jgi:hypothetical protein
MSEFLLPAAFAAAIAVIHLVFGGLDIARPLLQQIVMLTPVTLTHYYCWHMVTITLACLAAAYAYAAFASDGYILAICATLLSGLFGIWGLGLVLWKRQRHRDMPQWMLFAILTASGIWALVA